MTILVIGRSALSFSPFHRWFADADDDLVLLTTASRLDVAPDERDAVLRRYTEVRLYEDLDDGEVDADLLALGERYDVRGVVALSEYDLIRAGALRDHLGVAGPSLASALAFRDKVRMRDLLAGVAPAPAYAPLVRALDLVEFVEAHRYPVVVKPRRGAGAVGVQIVRDRDDALEVLAHRWSPRVEEVPDLMVEAFVPGPLLHVDGLVVDGDVRLCWPSRYLDDPSAFDRNSRLGSVLLDPGDPLVPRLQRLVGDVLAALPTPAVASFHAEVFHTPDDRLVLGEIASRTGGGRVNDTVRHAFGVNLNHAVARAQAGLPVTDAERVDEAAALAASGVAGWVVCYAPGPGRALHTPAAEEAPVGTDVRITPAVARAGGTASSVDGIASAVVVGPDAACVAERIATFARWFSERLVWEDAA